MVLGQGFFDIIFVMRHALFVMGILIGSY